MKYVESLLNRELILGPLHVLFINDKEYKTDSLGQSIADFCQLYAFSHSNKALLHMSITSLGSLTDASLMNTCLEHGEER